MTMTRRFKHTLLTLALLSCAAGASAQVGESRNILAFGVSAGATNANIDFNPTVKQDIYIGRTAGISARYTSEKYFFLICGTQIECNYVERGWKELIRDGSGNEYCRRLNYLEVPFYAHLGFGREARGIQGFVNLGPQIGWYLGGKEYIGGREPWDISKRPNGVTEQYGKDVEKKFEYGISGGLGMEFKTGAGNFALEGRYYFGLSDIYGNSKKDYFGRSASTTIYAKLAYYFQL